MSEFLNYGNSAALATACLRYEFCPGTRPIVHNVDSVMRAKVSLCYSDTLFIIYLTIFTGDNYEN